MSKRLMIGCMSFLIFILAIYIGEKTTPFEVSTSFMSRLLSEDVPSDDQLFRTRGHTLYVSWCAQHGPLQTAFGPAIRENIIKEHYRKVPGPHAIRRQEVDVDGEG